ncbi:MAG: DUF167 domain-containing protein [Sphingobium sp.]|nr:DUF167 domain-containing protein [Sphingobium sp.]
MPLRRNGADLILSIRLTPKSSRERIGGVFADAQGQNWLQASVTAPPDKGKANAALLALLAGTLKLPASSILLETGDTSRLKRLRLKDCTPDAEDLLRQIASKERTGT